MKALLPKEVGRILDEASPAWATLDTQLATA